VHDDPKRLIEVDLPIARISALAREEGVRAISVNLNTYDPAVQPVASAIFMGRELGASPLDGD